MPKLEWFIGDLHIKKLKLYFKDVPLSDITPTMVDDTFRRMAEDGVSQHQRSKLFGLLRRSLRYAQKRGDIASNACDLCDGYSYKGPDPKRKEEKRISTSELQRFLRELDAEALADIMGQGDRVAVDGRLHQSRWEADGAKRSKIEVIADDVEVMRARKGDAS